MTVRLRLALTVFVAGLITALGVMATVVTAFQRFEHERTYDRGTAFLARVLAAHDDILDLHARQPEQFEAWLRSLLLYEPDTQLYLLAADGRVLSASCAVPPPPGTKVALAPVREAAAAAEGGQRMPYVMGDDPERMNADAIITARSLRQAKIGSPGDGPAGYLYLVAQPPQLPAGHLAVFRSSFGGPALVAVAAVVALTTALAAWIVITVTRPLRIISDEVARAAREGFDAAPATSSATTLRSDEFGRLQAGFQSLLGTLRRQWDTLRTLDHFRREGVSNLSHDLRSPLTATAASLETLQRRWTGDASRAEDAALLEVALRNTHNAARLVRSLGDLALLDEPQYKLSPVMIDLGEVLEDIAQRFAPRARQQEVALYCELPDEGGGRPPFARVDVELFERAVANLVDNALKFTPAGGRITLRADAVGEELRIAVTDNGSGIAASDLLHLFDRLYRAQDSVAPATGEGGKGLGLAIVKRIAELHGGRVQADSTPGRGTVVSIALPRA